MTVRTQGISGTEIAGLFGMSPYKTRFSIYADKLGLVDQPPTTERMRVGKLLEPVVTKLWEENTGQNVRWSDELMEHPKEPLVIGTPDGFVGDDAGFEAKTAGLDRSFEWGDLADQIPPHYIFQAQYYSMLTGRKTWHVGALIGGNEFRRFELKADDEMQALMLDEVRRFWKECIEPQKAPEIDSSPAAKQYLLRLFPSPTEGIREASEGEDELIMGILRARGELKFLEERKETLQNQLKQSIGFAKGLTSQYGKASWSETKETIVQSFTRKAGRTLRVYGKKGEGE